MTRVPKVKQCEMTECGFNDDRKCHAAAIQVGDQVGVAVAERQGVALQDPKCDTFTRHPGGHFGAGDLLAQVGACKADTCTFNDHLRCTAEGITVGHHESHADCQTYRPRSQGR